MNDSKEMAGNIEKEQSNGNNETDSANSSKKQDSGKEKKGSIGDKGLGLEKPQLPKNFYKEMGFYHMVQKRSSLDELIIEQTEIHQLEIELIENRHNGVRDCIIGEIESLSAELESIKLRLIEYQNSRLLLESSSVELKEDIERLKKRLINIYKEFQVEKKDFVDKKTHNRLEQLGDEIRLLVKNSEILSEMSREKFGDLVAKNKQGKDEYLKHLQNEAKEAESRLNRVNVLIRKLNEKVVNQLTVRILGLISLVALGASGWFFSIFAVEQQLDSADQSSFLLGLIFNFGESVFNQDLGIANNFNILLAMILVVVCTLILVSGFFWFCSWLMLEGWKKKKQAVLVDRSGNTMVLPIGNESSKVITPWTIWLKNVPYILVAILIFVFLVFFSSYSHYNSGNDGTTELNELTIALSAQVIGVALGLLAGGVLFLYFNSVLESRAAKREQMEPRNYWELFLVVGVFFLLIICVPFLNLLGEEKEMANVTLVLFYLSLLANGVVIAYYIKFLSLLSTRNSEQTKISQLHASFDWIYRQNALGEEVGINETLKEAIDKLNSQMIASISSENTEAILIADQKLNTKNARTNRILERLNERLVSSINKARDWLQRVFKSRSNEENDKETQGKVLEVEDEIQEGLKELMNDVGEFKDYVAKEYFLDKYYEIKDLVQTLKEKGKNLKKIEKEIELIRLDEGPFIERLKKRIAKMEQKQISKNEAVIKRDNKRNVEVNRLRAQFQKVKLDLIEGFELGNWFVKNNHAS